MFAKITARNFFSWKHLEFKFDSGGSSGIILIAGQNLDDNTSEGSGKSSIPNALCWALYGQLPKDVNIDDVIKTGAKDCCVEVELLDGTKIVRSRKPNQLYIEHNGSIETGKDLKDTQKLVDAEIGMGFDTFCQSVYFAQNYSNKFITANQEQKAKILSELQDLSVFDRSSKKAHELLKKAVSDLSILDMKLAEKILTLNSYRDNIKNLEQFEKNFQSTQDKKISELKFKHSDLSVTIDAFQAEVQPIVDNTSLEEQLDVFVKARTDIDKQLYHIEQLKTQKANAELNKSCPTCKRPMDNNIHLDIPDDSKLLDDRQALSEQIGSMVSEGLENNSINSKTEYALKQISEAVAEKSRIEAQIKSLEISVNPYSELVLQSKSKIDPLEKAVEDIKSLQEAAKKSIVYLEFLKSGYKEIKSYVFQGLLAELNSKTNKYLRDLFEVPAYITFDNISSEGDISKIQTTVMLDGYERSLGLLSGGQFRRVQLAVDFALSEIVSERSEKPINIRILDEAFKDLSEPSMEKMLDVLQRMKGCTVLIEHNSLIKNIVNTVYNVELKNGTSTAQS